jgi:hypothetical protein
VLVGAAVDVGQELLRSARKVGKELGVGGTAVSGAIVGVGVGPSSQPTITNQAKTANQTNHLPLTLATCQSQQG